MNLKLEFDKVEFENVELRTEYLVNRLARPTLKLILLMNYQKDKLESNKYILNFKDELKITSYKNNKNFKINDKVELYCATKKNKYNLKIGTGIILDIKPNNEIIIKPIEIFNNNRLLNKPEQLFKPLSNILKADHIFNQDKKLKEVYKNKYKNYCNNIDKNKDKYMNNLFKYYYDFIIQILKDNNNYYSIGKLKALGSYQIAKKFFLNNKKNVSYPNVFIRDFDVEFDILLLKNNVPCDKYVYEINEVEAIVELKSDGIICYGKNEEKVVSEFNNKRWFHAYITFDTNYQKNNKRFDEYSNNINDKNLKEAYLKIKKQITEKQFIYFCFYDRNTKSRKTYENTYIDLLSAGTNYQGIYTCIIDENDNFIIPIDYDIDEIMNSIN